MAYPLCGVTKESSKDRQVARTSSAGNPLAIASARSVRALAVHSEGNGGAPTLLVTTAPVLRLRRIRPSWRRRS